jgi:hypothetical protein
MNYYKGEGNMKIKSVSSIKTKSEARQYAIDWQKWASNRNMGYGEYAFWQDQFIYLGRQFHLVNEFKENGII